MTRQRGKRAVVLSVAASALLSLAACGDACE
jgi:predicted small lipoprotein YifL